MVTKHKITVRFIMERDFEIETTTDWLGSGMLVSDWMVMSGNCQGWSADGEEDHTVNENIFERPLGPFRFVNNMHMHDANMFNVMESGMYDEEIYEAWTVQENN
jgi:hypothetical protein